MQTASSFHGGGEAVNRALVTDYLTGASPENSRLAD